jgi:rhamnogalacturonyl hydrolase YesR
VSSASARASPPAPVLILGQVIAAMLRQSPHNCTFYNYNYGPGYAFAAVFEAAAAPFNLVNVTSRVSATMDAFLLPGQYGYNVSHGVPMPYTGAVGEPTAFALAYAARSRDAVDASVARTTADVYMLAYPYRLPDGTFVRPSGWGDEVGDAFLWGDDQFMGLALLCRLSRAGAPNASEYLAVAVRNALTNAAFAQQAGGLFPHGLNTRTNASSCCLWGRANGWVAMSLVELLIALPPDAPDRPAVLRIFGDLAAGLALAQDAQDGRWHQVLNESGTFLETSATAMFTFALATGVSEGWLPRAAYAATIEAAWAGLTRAVADDGTVDGICQGTPVLLSVAAYNARTTFYNTSDPGLGAVMRAAMAVARFQGVPVE